MTSRRSFLRGLATVAAACAMPAKMLLSNERSAPTAPPIKYETCCPEDVVECDCPDCPSHITVEIDGLVYGMATYDCDNRHWVLTYDSTSALK